MRSIKAKPIKTALAIILLCLMIIPQTGCGSQNQDPVSDSGFYLDTYCEITVYNMDEAEAAPIISDALDKIGEYEDIFSKTVKGSDVWNINNAGGEPTEVTEETYNVVKAGIEMGDLTDGVFDITVGALSSLWDFTSDDPKVPDQADIDAALKTVDYRCVDVSKEKAQKGDGSVYTVQLTKDGAQLDLGGIAKGYIADLIGEFLEDKGVESAIVNLGGDIVTVGEKSRGTEFTIGIERPYSDRKEVIGSVQASDEAIVTSGVYERMFEEDGVTYHHVLDVNTGYSADTDLESVTVEAQKGNAYFCDGVATACLAMGKEKALALVEKIQKDMPDLDLEAAFIDNNDDMVQTDGMEIEESKESEETE